ncbi:MAG: hypothetical protein A2Y13_04500 [Planctomycetes bacterium GWC2_45_44]|nr:MAG: hypothetical protein A2Y13_04500 [Planctomycetes bacterium GWC2_45_44]HBR19414.1 hypothetical protein [Phycisphaerales bacterium]
MIIGIIGAENTHSAAIAKTINVEKKIKGFSVRYIWGETLQFARTAAAEGRIEHVVRNPSEMLGKIDALIVDHRHPIFHLVAAEPFIRRGIPVFIDKPFCYRVLQGKTFLRRAVKYRACVTSFSLLPEQAAFRDFTLQLKKIGKVLSAGTYGPCDLKSPYGGIFFYGIHQVEMALKAFGYGVNKVALTKNEESATGLLLYPGEKIVTLNFIKNGCPGFGIWAVGSKGSISKQICFDKNVYLAGIQKFTKMFKTRREPIEYNRILNPIQILEAFQKAGKSGIPEKVKA